MKQLIVVILILLSKLIYCQSGATYTGIGDYIWVAPAGVTSVMIDVWGTGGNGGDGTGFFGYGASGGGGGGYSRKNSYAVIPGNSYAVHIGGAGGTVYFNDIFTVLANCGSNGSIGPVPDPMAGGIGGSTAGAVGDVKTAGGNGGIWSNLYGAGGSGGGSGGNGGNGGNGNPATSFGAPGSGGNAGLSSPGGVAGAVGVGFGADGIAGTIPGGGGSGAANFGLAGGAGGSGQVVITYLTVLPVTWLNVSAVCTGSSVSVLWTTASETNNEFFSVERTNDGISWLMIGVVSGSNNSNSAISYSFTVDEPPSGIVYYRIKQTDYNGQFEYSGIVSLNTAGCQENSYTVTASQTSPGCFLIEGLIGNETVIVYSLAGERVLENSFGSEDQLIENGILNLSHCATGIYLITIIDSHKSTTFKILKS